MIRTYTIDKTAEGYRLKMYEDGEEAGGGWFPFDIEDGIDYSLEDAQETGDEFMCDPFRRL